jgi:hypothetical protein
MTFEKEKRAIDLFVKKFGGSYQKLGATDVGYKIFDSENKHIGYAELTERVRTMYDAYPLPVQVKKLVKLMDKRITSAVIWVCEDGIIYGHVDKIKGEIKWGSKASPLTDELMAYYDKQSSLKYVRFSPNPS